MSLSPSCFVSPSVGVRVSSASLEFVPLAAPGLLPEPFSAPVLDRVTDSARFDFGGELPVDQIAFRVPSVRAVGTDLLALGFLCQALGTAGTVGLPASLSGGAAFVDVLGLPDDCSEVLAFSCASCPYLAGRVGASFAVAESVVLIPVVA